MTLNEIAYNLLNLVRGGRSSHDEHISLDQIKFNIKHYRAMFIRRDYERNRLITRHIEQDLGCLKLMKVDATRCCSLPSTCIVYRTELPIPKTIRFNFKEAITHVGDITGVSTIPFINSNAVKWLPYDTYTNKKYKAYMLENHMYIYNAEGLEYINIRGVFEDPSHVEAYTCCGNDCTSCYNDNSEFPLPMDMVNMINSGILNGELRLLSGTMSDTENDRMQDPQTLLRMGSSKSKKTETKE